MHSIICAWKGFTGMKKKMLKVVSTVGALMVGVSLLSACGDKSDTKNPADAKNPVVTITMENGKTIVIELYPDKAPNTVNNFISLVQDGFYDGLTFHRVVPEFVIQGGDPEGSGMGGPGYSIKGEFKSNGFADNDISHEVGVISMARSRSYDSAGSQFFICTGAYSLSLDGDYAAFGKVTAGMDEALEIGKLNPGDGPPSTPQIMKSVTVDTFGVEYPKPVKS
jgi:peptidyl-prolyl cis-trans isomerase B (cyclophilin B)